MMRNKKKKLFLKNLYNFLEAREKVLKGFSSKIFSIKSKGSGLLNTDCSKLKILTPKTNASKIANISCTSKSR